jgi:CBS domain-containing protein
MSRTASISAPSGRINAQLVLYNTSHDNGRRGQRDEESIVANYHLCARDLMHPEIATVVDNATVQEAADIMRLEGVRSLIVLPGNDDDVVGIISYADIVSKVLAEEREPAAVPVYDVMTRPAITIPPTMRVADIARLFRHTRIGHAPVVEGRRVVGMVSMTDLITEVIPEPA